MSLSLNYLTQPQFFFGRYSKDSINQEYKGKLRKRSSACINRFNIEINILFNESKQTYRSDFYLRLFVKESLEIYSRDSDIFNDTLSFHITNIWVHG